MGRASSSSLVFAVAYAAFVLGVFLALGGAAYAQTGPTSATDQYVTKVVDVTVEETTETESAVVDVAQALPSTGLSLVATALVGGVLVGLGVALRRRERRKQ